ncbi:hypothetical protein [Cellulomonas fengjieae]|uniref:hypothetical protein n=1 Tax=Cellulomonas fengjieae TaxID=2819978 RepID=UPI0020C07710|nr:hypothetical protein [Cellulomonas fengjieae]
MPTPARPRASLLRGAVLTLVLALVGVFLVTPAQAADDPAPAPVLLVGVTGVRWDDVTTLTTPALWSMSREGSIGLVAARSVASRSCPADGWLAVSTGTRAADVGVDDGTCRTLRDPGESGQVPGWEEYVAAADAESYGATAGLLGDALAAAGSAVTGIGPGAAIALADTAGFPVGTHEALPTTSTGITQAVRDALGTSRLVVVDAGSLRDPGYATASRPSVPQPTETVPGELTEPTPPDVSTPDAIVEPSRALQAQAIDERVGAAIAGAQRSGATVLVVSLADSGRTALQLAAATGLAPDGDEYVDSLLTSGSTRQPGLIQTVDVTPTLLAGIGLDNSAAAFSGAEILPGPPTGTATARLAELLDIQRHATMVTRVSSDYSTRLVLIQAVLFIAAAIILSRTGRSDRRPLRPALRVLHVAALALAAAPVASFLTNTIPWWRAGTPVTAFWWVLLGWIAAITALALVGPWRRNLLGPAGVVAGVTVAVLVVTACTGSTLIIDSPMGAHRLLAARFYGMSNQAFALLTAGGLLLAVAIADPLLRKGRRTLATVAVAALGLVLVVVDGAPGLGSDFGGPPALILAFAMLTIVVSGRRVSWRWIGLIALVGAVVVGGFAVLDWLRPAADRTHLGRFFATVLDGGLWDVVERKIAVNLRVLTSWRYLVTAIGGIALTWLVVVGGRPRRGALMGQGPLAGLTSAVPLLRPAIAAITAALTVGFLMNDSGIVVPATGIALAVPCLVAAAAQWRLGAPEGDVAPAAGELAADQPPTSGGSAEASARGPRSA